MAETITNTPPRIMKGEMGKACGRTTVVELIKADKNSINGEATECLHLKCHYFVM